MTRTANVVRRMLAMTMAYCATSDAAHAQAAGSSTPASSQGGDVAQPTAPEAWAGYTAGGSAEWYRGGWVAPAGAFLTSNVPNSELIDTRFRQYQPIGEIEEAHTPFGHPGKLRVTGFVTRADQAKFRRALDLAQAAGGVPDLAAVRRFTSRPGISLNLEQAITPNSASLRARGDADGSQETFDFSAIHRTVSGGASLKGARWRRPGDTIGIAGVIDGISRARQAFLAAGGLGFLIGDGKLTHPGDEHILEAYYDLRLGKGGHLAIDYQWVENPGYSKDRGSISALAMRVHGQF